MFEIKDGKVVKKETTEVIIEISSKAIEQEINSINDVIKGLNEQKEQLAKDLQVVLKLEESI